MKLDIRKQTRLLLWIPMVLSLVIIVSGVFGVNIIDGTPTVDTFSFVCMCISFVMIALFTFVVDKKRSNYQWKIKPLIYIQIGTLVAFLFALASLNIDLMFTILLLFGVVYFITTTLYLLFKKKLIITEAQRKPFLNIGGELPYEFTSKKVYAFNKLSGAFVIFIALLGIVFMYANGSVLGDVLPYSILCIGVYILSKFLILKHEKNVDSRISTDFYAKLNGQASIDYIDKILSEKLHKDKAFEIKLIKVEILEYMGEHETAKKVFKSLGKPNATSEFTYEFVALDFLEKTDEESYFKALKRIEKKISTIKKEKNMHRVMLLLEDTKTEINVRFNKKLTQEQMERLSNGHYQLTRIRNNTILGRHYYNIKDYESAKHCLEYVVKYGRDAKKFIHTAEKILDKIAQNGK